MLLREAMNRTQDSDRKILAVKLPAIILEGAEGIRVTVGADQVAAPRAGGRGPLGGHTRVVHRARLVLLVENIREVFGNFKATRTTSSSRHDLKIQETLYH